MPPKPAEVWSQTEGELAKLWQPIAVESTNIENDLMLSESSTCDESTMEMLRMYVDPKVQKFLADNANFISDLAHHSGSHFRTPLDVIKLFDAITCEVFWVFTQNIYF